MSEVAKINERDDFYEIMSKVMSLFVKGTTNPSTIAHKLGMKRRDVVDCIQAWKDLARTDQRVKDRAVESLKAMDEHYDLIVEEMWSVIEDPTVDLKTKAGTLKNVADVDAKRYEILQKTGMFEDNEITEQLLEMEEYTEGIKAILKDVIKKYPETKRFIIERLSGAGDTVSVTVDGEIVE